MAMNQRGSMNIQEEVLFYKPDDMDNTFDLERLQKTEENLMKSKLKNFYLQIIIGVLLISLIGIIAHLYGSLRKENNEFRSKINDIAKVEKLNGNLVIAYDEQVNRTKVFEEERKELLINIGQLQQSIKYEKDISNKLKKKNDDNDLKLNEEIERCNNACETKVNLLKDKEKILVQNNENECFAVAKKLYNENRASNWTELKSLAENFDKITENNDENSDNKVQLNCTESERNANLILENEKLKKEYDDLQQRYMEKVYAEENLAASLRGKTPVTDDSSTWTGFVSFFKTSNAQQNTIHPLLIIMQLLITIFVLNKF